ncbi:hypothetical protein LCGC14_1310550 [marine sediment metagenome]|uniref:Uncharacterized protein n=1 Tax=marine sediment metagenome TaxID=412755 RepID=A0A0F9L7H9_9ZZZZ
MIHIRYILNRALDILGHDEALKEFWVYQGAVPSVEDAVVIYGSVFQVAGVMWMIGAPMYDKDTLAKIPLGRRDGDLHVVAISLKYLKDLP